MTYDRLAELDRQALRTVEAYCRMTQEATMTKASPTRSQSIRPHTPMRC